MRVLCANEGFISNFELLELLRQRTHEPGHQPRYPQPHDPFPTELQVRPRRDKATVTCAFAQLFPLRPNAVLRLSSTVRGWSTDKRF